MTDPCLWIAVREQAVSWADLPVFQRFRAQLPRNAPQCSAGVPGQLQHMEAGGGWVSSMPLLLGFSAQWMLDTVQRGASDGGGEQFRSWLSDAQRLESAHRDTMAWLRSRLPGYPSLPAPQLVSGTPITTVEFGWQVGWAPDERARGLQFLAAPPLTGAVLQTTEGERRRIGQAARRLANAFERSDEWALLSSATEALDSEARANLRRVRASLRQRLTAESVSTHEPNRAHARAKYRHVVMLEEIASLSGSAREYSDAFDVANQLVETAASRVFGQLAAYGEPTQYPPPQQLDIQSGSPQVVSFTITDPLWPDMGALVWVDEPLIRDAVCITAVTSNHDAATGSQHRVSGTVLAGTAAAWRPPT
jgi:hypothetical protein